MTCSKFDECTYVQDFANGNFLAVQWRTETATGDMAQCYEEVLRPKKERICIRSVFTKILPVCFGHVELRQIAPTGTVRHVPSCSPAPQFKSTRYYMSPLYVSFYLVHRTMNRIFWLSSTLSRPCGHQTAVLYGNQLLILIDAHRCEP